MCGVPIKIKIIAIVLTIAHPANLCAFEIAPRAIYESHYQLLILRRLLCRTLLRLLQSWELLMISKLEWNITAVTAFDYVDQILERVNWGSDDSRLREHAHTLIHVCSTGKFRNLCLPLLSIFRPSNCHPSNCQIA